MKLYFNKRIVLLNDFGRSNYQVNFKCRYTLSKINRPITLMQRRTITEIIFRYNIIILL